MLSYGCAGRSLYSYGGVINVAQASAVSDNLLLVAASRSAQVTTSPLSCWTNEYSSYLASN